MSKIKNIIQGWSNYLSEEKEHIKLFEKRAYICNDCDRKELGTYEKMMPDYSLKKIQGHRCGECLCPLSTKIRAIDKVCPLKKW